MTVKTASGGHAGFTLIEIMIVIALLGIIVTIAILRVPDTEDRLANEAARVVAAIDLLSEQAIVRGLPQSIAIERRMVRLREFRGGQWHAKRLPGIRAERLLPDGMRLTIGDAGVTLGNVKSIVMLPSGDVSAETFTLADDATGDRVDYATNAWGRFVVVR